MEVILNPLADNKTMVSVSDGKLQTKYDGTAPQAEKRKCPNKKWLHPILFIRKLHWRRIKMEKPILQKRQSHMWLEPTERCKQEC
jgi:hypothetical protein